MLIWRKNCKNLIVFVKLTFTNQFHGKFLRNWFFSWNELLLNLKDFTHWFHEKIVKKFFFFISSPRWNVSTRRIWPNDFSHEKRFTSLISCDRISFSSICCPRFDRRYKKTKMKFAISRIFSFKSVYSLFQKYIFLRNIFYGLGRPYK